MFGPHHCNTTMLVTLICKDTLRWYSPEAWGMQHPVKLCSLQQELPVFVWDAVLAPIGVWSLWRQHWMSCARPLHSHRGGGWLVETTPHLLSPAGREEKYTGLKIGSTPDGGGGVHAARSLAVQETKSQSQNIFPQLSSSLGMKHEVVAPITDDNSKHNIYNNNNDKIIVWWTTRPDFQLTSPDTASSLKYRMVSTGLRPGIMWAYMLALHQHHGLTYLMVIKSFPSPTSTTSFMLVWHYKLPHCLNDFNSSRVLIMSNYYGTMFSNPSFQAMAEIILPVEWTPDCPLNSLHAETGRVLVQQVRLCVTARHLLSISLLVSTRRCWQEQLGGKKEKLSG